MLGAFLGDIVGSPFEFDRGRKVKDFHMFGHGCTITDDSVMSAAVCEALLAAGTEAEISEIERRVAASMQDWGHRYPNAGYGGRFSCWLRSRNPQPYRSYGNGSAMRVSAAGWLYPTLARTRRVARATANVTHNHPEGLKGAEATAIAVFMALHGAAKDEIRAVMEKEYYPCEVTLAEYRRRKDGHGAETCMVSVPQALQCFYEGEDYEDVIRSCISIGGDCDTTGAIAGAIAGAYYGIEDELYEKVKMQYLPADLREIVENFDAKYGG